MVMEDEEVKDWMVKLLDLEDDDVGKEVLDQWIKERGVLRVFRKVLDITINFGVGV